MCSGSSTSATIASVNAPSNQLHHLSYDRAAYAGLDISTACHPPSLLEESMTSTQTSMAGRDPQAAPKLDGLIQSSTISILLASTPPMLPNMVFDRPQWKAFVSGLPTFEPVRLVSQVSQHIIYNIHNNAMFLCMYGFFHSCLHRYNVFFYIVCSKTIC